MHKILWKAITAVSAMGAAWAARQATTTAWARVSDNDAPVNPADRSITWTAALGWALLAGLAAGLGRVVARRGAAAGWEAATGEPPPGIAKA